MKNSKFELAKGARTFLVLAMTLTIAISTSLPTFAEIKVGDEVIYYGWHNNSAPLFSATMDGKTFEGVCAEAKATLATSGTATVQRKIGNDTKVAKMIYDTVYVKHWLEDPKFNQSISQEVGLDYTSSFVLGNLVPYIAQMGIEGADYWHNHVLSLGDDVIDSAVADAVYNWYNDYDVSGITVPDGFEMYYMSAGTDQNFVLFTYSPSGTLKLKKASANPSITNG